MIGQKERLKRISKVIKRDGQIVPFNIEKIENAIIKAVIAVGADKKISKPITQEIIATLIERKIFIPTIEQIQDAVEEALVKNKQERVAKAYMLYRRSRAHAREVKKFFGIKDDLKFGANAIKVLWERYLLRDKEGNIIETPTEMFERVAKTIASAEKDDGKKWEKEFFEIMKNLEFLPNSPTLMNAGTNMGQLSACFVLPIEDSLESIFTTLKNMALIQQSGGGTGFSFSRLRPQGEIVKSTKGIASGPVSFMKIYDTATETIKQGGKRRGANMAVLNSNHPDIIEFINSKQKEKQLSNFNISVAVDDKFLEAVEKNKDYNLINPLTKKSSGKINARKLFDLICSAAWQTGDPGMVFIDEINRKSQIKGEKIEATNPCVTSDSWIMTSKGPRQVQDIIGVETEIILDGKKWHNSGNGFFSTGVKQIFKLESKEGFEISLTENHPVRIITKLTRYSIDSEWKNTGELKAGDKVLLNNHQDLRWNGKFSEGEGYLVGHIIGDGTISKERTIFDSWGESEGERKVREKIEDYIKNFPHRSDFKGWRHIVKEGKYRLVSVYFKGILNEIGIDGKKIITPELEKASYEFYAGFLRGFFDTDGSVQGSQKKGVSVRLAQSDIERLKAVQRMLLRLGIYSKVYQNRREAGTKEMPDGEGGSKSYQIKPQHELIISGENILHYNEKIGFENSDKQNKLDGLIKIYKRKLNRERFIATVKALIPLEKREVYDIQVPGINAFDANGFYVHNCGEVPLLPYESCNLGSINLTKIVENKKINWDKLKKLVHTGVRFLDDVISVNKYPFPELEKMAKSNRRIGLGVMGFAEMLILLETSFDSKEAIKTAEGVMSFINKEAHSASVNLAKERGNFPNIQNSVWKGKKMRNCACTTIAPTGSISIIAGCSSGIEPLFAIAFMREILEGKRLFEVNKIFQEIAIKEGFYSKELMEKIVLNGNLKSLNVSARIKELFKTALDVPFEQHIKIQAAFQRHTDNAVSKTINLPKNASIDSIKTSYLLAYKLKCKGITIYRYGSKPEQVLYLGTGNKPSKATTEFTGGSCISRVCSL